MEAGKRFVKGIADELVKLSILLFLDFILVSCPESLYRIYCIAFDLDGERNKV